MSKYGDFSGPYFPVFGLNTGKYRPEKAPYLDAFHAAQPLTFVTEVHLKCCWAPSRVASRPKMLAFNRYGRVREKKKKKKKCPQKMIKSGFFSLINF